MQLLVHVTAYLEALLVAGNCVVVALCSTTSYEINLTMFTLLQNKALHTTSYVFNLTMFTVLENKAMHTTSYLI